MGELTTVREAVAGPVEDGDSVAVGGFAHPIPHAAAQEIIRRERLLTPTGMTPDLICDRMIGMGRAQKPVSSYVGNPGVGSLRRFGDAVENGRPHEPRIEEHGHAGMASRYVAGAPNLPYAVALDEEEIPGVMQRIADALGTGGAARGLHDLAEKIDAPTALKDIGMREENTDEAAPGDNPRAVDGAGIRSILEDAHAGRRPQPAAERSI